MPGAARVFLQVETDSGRVGWQPQPWRTQKNNTRAICLCLCPSSPDFRVQPCPICTLSSWTPQDWIPPGSLGAGQDSEGKAHHPWSMTSLPRCCGLAETGLEGAREEPAGTGAWHPAPSSRPLSCPGCSCAKALVSSCPRLGAEHALGICHEAVGNFATGGQSGKRGLPSVSFSVSFTPVHTKEAVRKPAESQLLP